MAARIGQMGQCVRYSDELLVDACNVVSDYLKTKSTIVACEVSNRIVQQRVDARLDQLSRERNVDGLRNPQVTATVAPACGCITRGVCPSLARLAAQPSASLASCPPRQPVLRIALVSGAESYSSHPAETRFSFHPLYAARLHQMPLIGADPKEQRIDAYYGSAESR